MDSVDLEVLKAAIDLGSIGHRVTLGTVTHKRPNALGLSVVRLIEVEVDGAVIEELDILNETPLLDIKPYVPAFDCRQTEKIGWFAGRTDAAATLRADNRFERYASLVPKLSIQSRLLQGALIAALWILQSGLPAFAAEESAALELVPMQGSPLRLDRAALELLPQVEVRQRDAKSGAHVYTGPTVRSLLTRLGIPEGEPLRGNNLKIAVLAEGRDGYKVVFAVAELDPSFSKRVTIVATREDGKPMDVIQGPLRMAVEGELRPARWVRQVARLRIVMVD